MRSCAQIDHGPKRWLDHNGYSNPSWRKIRGSRQWRSLKYECVYLHAFETGSELPVGLTRWIGYYNADRPHSGLAGQTPDEAYGANENLPLPGHAPATQTFQLAA